MLTSHIAHDGYRCMPRSIKLMLFFLAGIVAAAIILVSYQNRSERDALIKAERDQLYPPSTSDPSTPDPSTLDPSDPLTRAIYSHDGSNTEPGSSVAIRELLRTYLQPSDVIAVGAPEVERRAKSWTLFGGPTPRLWIERTAWCVRIKQRERAAAAFADSLFLISRLENAPALSLPAHASPLPDQALQETMARYADGLLLAVEFIRYGASRREIRSRTWRLAPDASVCPKGS